jgi:hypothetical protein
VAFSQSLTLKMKNRKLKSQTIKIGGGLLAGVLAPGMALGCACGCGIFEVGTSSMFPSVEGGMAFVNYAFQDQSQNWSNNSSAPAGNNPDKHIETDFITPGLQYMFNRSWGVQVELPFAYRYFKTLNAANQIVSTSWGSLGDIRLNAIYTGFSDDLSTGVNFGLKLPTGNDNYNPALVDRDTQIGTGSTDILLGGFHRGNLSASWRMDWFTQAQLDIPTLTQAQYRPGFELDAAAGIDYQGWTLGRANISPLAQVLVSERTKDYGAAADSPNSGYTRVLLSPGIEIHLHPIKIYADVEVPVFQNVNGNQLVAPALFKLGVSYMF